MKNINYKVSVYDESITPCPIKVYSCETIEEAENWINDYIAIDADKVYNGDFYIDAPEEYFN